MDAFEAIAMIGAGYVLISLYRAISRIERRYRAVWHGPRRDRRSKTGKHRAKRMGKRRFLTRWRRE